MVAHLKLDPNELPKKTPLKPRNQTLISNLI